MMEEYINLINTLIIFKTNHPQYSEKINKGLEAMEIDKVLIKAIELELNNGRESSC